MTPYLRAIQQIPGDTAGEKLKWIGSFNLDQRQGSGDLDQLPRELLPILRVENAIKKKIPEDITEALKSEDWTIVMRALQASWFFDGSHKNVIDVEYFRNNILPYVSLNARTRLFKTLTLRLAGKDPAFAQQMFTTVESIYGVQTAMVLLAACDEDFIYQTVVEKKIVLPYKLVRAIFLRNPDLIVSYLRLSKPCENNPYKINIRDYESLLPRLVKKRVEAFVELYEMHEERPPCVYLSNTCTETFLEKGTQYLMRKPRLYVKIMPFKKIDATRMESIFPGLLPDDGKQYNTDDMLIYLEHLPDDKKADLLCKAYRQRYGAELLDTSKNVTYGLMKLLPAEERVKQAKIKIEQDKLHNITHSIMDYENAWICYLSIKESIPAIKSKIVMASKDEERLGLIWRMIYTCKINKDDGALLDVLLYFKNRHKNEEQRIFDRTLSEITRLYDVAQFSERLSAVLYDIIRLCYVKHGRVTENVLIAMAHFRLLHDMPIAEPIEMLLETQNSLSYIYLKHMLNEHPHYERQCLVACIDVIQGRYNSTDWKENKKEFLYAIVEAMYEFNDRCKRSRSTVERMTVKDHPWLMDAVRQAIWDLSDQRYRYNELKDILRKNEPELHDEWYPKQLTKQQDIVDALVNGEALKKLRQNPQGILDNWEAYLAACKERCHCKMVRRFVRAARWYKDIPVKFAERCTGDLEQRRDEASSLAILAMLIHGESLTRLLDPLIPKETTVDTGHSEARDRYKFVLGLPLVMELCNPPVPLDLIARLCEGDHLRVALYSLVNLSRRTSLPKVMLFAQELTKKRVSVRKHGIRIMYMVAPIRELVDFLLSMWKTEDHHSIRGVLLQKAHELFYAERNSVLLSFSWSLLSALVSTLTLKDEMWLSDLTKSQRVPDEYRAEYIQLLFVTIDSLVTNGLDTKKAITHIANLLGTISESVCDRLPDELTESILRKYLFHEDVELSRKARLFTIDSYLLPAKDKFASRIKVFTNVFVSEVKNGWNVAHPRYRCFYPINYGVHRFMDDLVTTFLTSKSEKNTQVIPAMLKIFLSVLTPHMDANSYLLLVYAIERTKSVSPMEFGLQLSQRMPKLVETFSSLFLSFVIETLIRFLEYDKYEGLDNEEIKLGVIKGLAETSNAESSFMAAKILCSVYNKNSDISRYDDLVKKLRKINHPGINSVLCDYINKTYLIDI